MLVGCPRSVTPEGGLDFGGRFVQLGVGEVDVHLLLLWKVDVITIMLW